MILNGNARGGAGDLANHLMKDENEHIDVHELRGFSAQTLKGALHEAYAVSLGTNCRQFLYSLSLNPPKNECVGAADFEDAIERVEKKLGLDGHPRAIVFHEKEGRRHAHCVWSRIDAEEMKAVNLSYDRKKLKSVSRELFIHHGWNMPHGLSDSAKRDPRNFTLEEWQQAKRVGKDPRAVKTAIQDAWAISDNKASFIRALEERGYKIARGDRRGFVAIDSHGEVYSIPRKASVKTKEVRARLGDPNDLPNVATVKAEIAKAMHAKITVLRREAGDQNRNKRADFERRRRALVERQQTERQSLAETQEKRRVEDSKARQNRFRTGLGGLWDRLRGRHRQITKQNEEDAYTAAIRDQAARDKLVHKHLAERNQLNIFRMREVQDTRDLRRRLRRETKHYSEMRPESPSEETKAGEKEPDQTRTAPTPRGPSLEP